MITIYSFEMYSFWNISNVSVHSQSTPCVSRTCNCYFLKAMCLLKWRIWLWYKEKFILPTPSSPNLFQETIALSILLVEALWTFIRDTGKYTYNTFSVHISCYVIICNFGVLLYWGYLFIFGRKSWGIWRTTELLWTLQPIKSCRV